VILGKSIERRHTYVLRSKPPTLVTYERLYSYLENITPAMSDEVAETGTETGIYFPRVNRLG
jgi:hypothetical protein